MSIEFEFLVHALKMYRRPTLALEDPNTTAIIDSFGSGFLKTDVVQEILTHCGDYFLVLLRKLEERTQNRLDTWRAGLTIILRNDAPAWNKIAADLERKYLRILHSYQTMVILYIDTLYAQDLNYAKHSLNVHVPMFPTFIMRWLSKFVSTDDVQSQRYLTIMSERDRLLLLFATLRSVLNASLVNAVTETDPFVRSAVPSFATRRSPRPAPSSPNPMPSHPAHDPFSQLLARSRPEASPTASPLHSPFAPLSLSPTSPHTLFLNNDPPMSSPLTTTMVPIISSIPSPAMAEITPSPPPFLPPPSLPSPTPRVEDEEAALDRRLAEATARALEWEQGITTPQTATASPPPLPPTPDTHPRQPWTDTQDIMRTLVPTTPYSAATLAEPTPITTSCSSIVLQDVTPQQPPRFNFPAAFELEPPPPSSPRPSPLVPPTSQELADFDEVSDSRSQVMGNNTPLTTTALTPYQLTHAHLEALNSTLAQTGEVFRGAATLESLFRQQMPF